MLVENIKIHTELKLDKHLISKLDKHLISIKKILLNQRLIRVLQLSGNKFNSELLPNLVIEQSKSTQSNFKIYLTY